MKHYEFADFRICPETRKIFRKGLEIKIRDRDFDVLLFFIKNKGEVLTRDRIIKIVWSGTLVEDNSVEKAVVNIRKLLDDDASNPKFVKTVRGRGYIFIHPIKEEFDDPFEMSAEIKSDRVSAPLYRISGFVKPGIIVSLLTIVFAGILLWNGGDIYKFFTRTVIFSDQFSSLDNRKWGASGRSVRIDNGVLKITVDEMDNGGKLVSKRFLFDPRKPITIESRVKVSFNQNIEEYVEFEGILGLLVDKSDAPGNLDVFYGVKYGNGVTKFKREGKVTTNGFYLIRDNADIFEEYHHCNGSVGPKTPPLWKQWFDQKIVYEPDKGSMTLYIDGKEKGEFIIGRLPVGKKPKLRLIIYPRGAWLHHSIEVDHLLVTQ